MFYTDKEIIVFDFDGVIVAPGFGSRGIEGKIKAIKCARENNIPFFGICLGMQMAVIEFARNELNIKNATSSEFGSSKASVVGLMSEWVYVSILECRVGGHSRGS